MKISGRTKVCALIGDPVEHSLSPSIQNAAFQHLDLDYVYLAFTVRGKNLENAILGSRSLGLHGLNVTMPHKTDVVRYLDQLDETARKVGSVNTILNQNGRMIGYTTDGIGALNALLYGGVNPSGKKIVVLGAGGASRSISFTLAREAKEFVILNRTFEKAESLINDLFGPLGSDANLKAGRLNDANLKEELKDAEIVINATSVGMHPKEAETPVNSSFLNRSMAVFDLVYEPLETRLLREAKIAGAETIDGLSMLVHQGAASFEIWTGKKAPIEIMMKTAKGKLMEKTR